MKYRQITSGERYAIGALRRRGLSARQIATELGRAHTTIAREIARNSCKDGGYRPFKASQRTNGRRSRSRRNARISPETWATVERYLRLDWSPEQVAGFLRVEGILRISHESIYLRVWRDKVAGGDLEDPGPAAVQRLVQGDDGRRGRPAIDHHLLRAACTERRQLAVDGRRGHLHDVRTGTVFGDRIRHGIARRVPFGSVLGRREIPRQPVSGRIEKDDVGHRMDIGFRNARIGQHVSAV